MSDSTHSQEQKRRSEKAGVVNFSKEMISALLMAFVFIVYVIQAFRIPTASMEQSLMIGDFLLGLKFIYGAPVLPFSYTKFPGVADPRPGDVVIFEYPGIDSKDYIKRCVAGPGQTVQIQQTKLYVDGVEQQLMPKGQHLSDGYIRPGITDFAPIRVPAAGDTLYPGQMPLREFVFAKNLIRQEHPRNRLIKFLESTPFTSGIFRRDLESERVRMEFQLTLDGESSDNAVIPISPARGGLVPRTFSEIVAHPEFAIQDDWWVLQMRLQDLRSAVEAAYPDKTVEIYRSIILDGKPVREYVVNNDNYFMMGDNRDRSADSRFWGFVNDKFVKARALIIYFSVDLVKRDAKGDVIYRSHPRLGQSPIRVPIILSPFHIRWDRFGKLIRSWHVPIPESRAPVPEAPPELPADTIQLEETPEMDTIAGMDVG